MMQTDRNMQVRFDISLVWQSGTTVHRENFHVHRGNIWRDMWSAGLGEFLSHAGPGSVGRLELEPGRPVPPHDDGKVIAVREKDIRPGSTTPCGGELRIGRFYPRGMLPPAAGVFRGDMRPFRVTGRDGHWIIADLNHPLSPYRLAAEVALVGRREKPAEIGGSCIDWLEESAAGGPGMQAPWKDAGTDFGGPGVFRRDDESTDALFYRQKRLVGHVDSLAGSRIRAFYGRLLPRGARVLDLMSSWQSHLPEEAGHEVTGLGMNRDEMSANAALSHSVVHDLNEDPTLPFAAGSFDAVVCSLSIEYLTRPDAVIVEAARVLRPGGLFLASLSERFFPTKAVRLWRELHPFERLGYVAEAVRAAGMFAVEETESFRNWPRPVDDLHYPAERLSDSVYLIAARKSDATVS